MWIRKLPNCPPGEDRQEKLSELRMWLLFGCVALKFSSKETTKASLNSLLSFGKALEHYENIL